MYANGNDGGKMAEQKIAPEMVVEDVTARYPETYKTFLHYGLHCVGCPISRHHTIAKIAQENGKELEPLLTDLNAAIGK